MALTKDEQAYLQRNLDAAKKFIADPASWEEAKEKEKDGRNDPNFKSPLGFTSLTEGLDVSSKFHVEVLRAQRYLSLRARGEDPEATDRTKEIAADPIMLEIHSVTPALKDVILKN